MQLLYSAYLGIGPWGAAEFLEGEPLGLIFMGSVVYFKDGQRHSEYRIDTSITTVLVMVFYMMPMTLLCASLTSRYPKLIDSFSACIPCSCKVLQGSLVS